MADNSLSELKEMQKMTSSMLKDYDKLLEGHGKVNKKLKERVDVQKNIVKGITDEKSAYEALKKLEDEYLKLGSKRYDNNKNVILALQLQNKEIRQQIKFSQIVVNAELKRQKVLDNVKKSTDDVTGKMKEGVDKLKENLEKIPFIGKLMTKQIPFDKINGGIDRMGKAFTGGFKGAYLKTMKQGGTATQGMLNGMKGGLSGVSTALSRLGPALTGPQAIIAAIVAVMALGVYRLYQMSEASKQFKQETGLLNSQIKFLGRQISYVSARTKFLGADMKDVATASATLSNEFHNLMEPSTAVVENIVVLNKNFGVSMDSAAKLTHMFMNMGHLTQEQAQAQTSIAVNMAKAAKVAPSKVIKDLADNSEAAYKYFGGSYKELVKAGVEAAKLGTSIGALTKTADNLLDFETSITDELQASAVLGRRFDLTQARAAAAADDLLGMNKAIVGELNKQGDITQLSKWDKMALAKATKMELGELVNMQKVYNKFGHLQEKQIGYAMEQAKLGKDVSKMTESELNALMEKDRLTQETQGKFTQMKNAFSGIGDTFLDAFLPIGEIVVGILVPAFKLIASFVKGFFTPFANFFKRISDSLSNVFSIFGGASGIMDYLITGFDYLGRIVGVFAGGFLKAIEMGWNMFQSILDVVSGIVSVVKGLFSGDMEMVGKGLMDIFKGVLGFFAAIPRAIINIAMDAFPELLGWLRDSLVGLFSNILPSWAKKLLGFSESSASSVQKEAAEPAGSVNDGVIQKGKIISTNPADTLIATKTPGDLLSQVMGATPLGAMINGIGSLLGGSGGGPNANNINELIAEVKGLRMDMASGKIAVNMDGRKITSGVSKVSAQSSGNSYVQK